MTADGAIASGALALLPERGVWSPAARTLFVADLHLGKASAFRAAGAPAPFGTSEELLRRLGALADSLGAERLVILGDFVHGKSSVTEGLAELLRSWRRRRSHLDCVVVLGNHDRRAAPLYDGCGFRIANEPTQAAGLDCRHYPLDGQARTQGPVTLAGHLHPVARITGRGRIRCDFRALFLTGGKSCCRPSGSSPAAVWCGPTKAGGSCLSPRAG